MKREQRDFREQMPRPVQRVPLEEEHTRLIHAMAARFDKTYVIDLRKYAPVYDAAFKEAFFFDESHGVVGAVMFGQTDNVQFDYSKDFAKVVTSAREVGRE